MDTRRFSHSFKELFNSINNINQYVDLRNGEINWEKYKALKDVLQKADKIEHLIHQYWNEKRNDLNFYYYIGLHYNSRLLADLIKAEQIKIRDAFVLQKKAMEPLGKRIEYLKTQQRKTNYSQRANIGVEISNLCTQHKIYSKFSNLLGEMNSNYHERLTYQNNLTRKRRIFIGKNFGIKGMEWESRIMKRSNNTRK